MVQQNAKSFDDHGEIAQVWTRDELLSIEYTPEQLKLIMAELARFGRGAPDRRQAVYSYTIDILQNEYGDRSAFTLDDRAYYSISDLRASSFNGLEMEYMPVVIPGGSMVIRREVESGDVEMLQLCRCTMRNGVAQDGEWMVTYNRITAKDRPDVDGID